MDRINKNVKRFVNGEISLDECLKEHAIICFNDIPASIVSGYGLWNEHSTTLNIFQRALNYANGTVNDNLIPEHKFINEISDNKPGFELLMMNMKLYLDDKKSLDECINTHREICSKHINDWIEYFSDGYTKDIHLNVFRYVLRATQGSKKDYDRLVIDLGIKDCNLTIVQIK